MNIIYHNPRCSKSREALSILNDKKIEVTIVEYLKDGLEYDTLNKIYKDLNLNSPIEMMRKKEQEFKQMGLSTSMNDEELLNSIVKCPKLLERPIVITKVGTRICRPPDKVMEII